MNKFASKFHPSKLREVTKILSLNLLLMLICTSTVSAQLTLEECYQKARTNYPLLKRSTLIEQTKQLSVKNISKGYLPQININGQATYQSDVTTLPISLPNTEIPTISKDQYKVYGEVVQPLTNGAYLKPQKQLAEANSIIEKQQLETDLYQLKERINQLFFGILLIDEQLIQTQLIKSELEANIEKVEAAILNGTAIRNNADLLTAEVLNLNQRLTEMKSQRRALVEMLGFFINQEISHTATFQRPDNQSIDTKSNRPELKLFNAQKQIFAIQNSLLQADKKPKLSLFLQTGYGRPALNFLNNDFDFYYLGGLRLNWNISSFYTAKNSQQLINIKQQNIEIQEETFLFNTNVAATQQSNEINKFQELLNSDDELVTLRTKIKNRANEQLTNGLITTTDYLSFITAEDKAKQAKILHEIQLLMAQYALKITTGN